MVNQELINRIRTILVDAYGGTDNTEPLCGGVRQSGSVQDKPPNA